MSICPRITVICSIRSVTTSRRIGVSNPPAGGTRVIVSWLAGSVAVSLSIMGAML